MKAKRKTKHSRHATELAASIAKSIDRWHTKHPRLKVRDVIGALEEVHGTLLRAWTRA